MKKIHLLMSAWMLVSGLALADAPRLTLQITAPIGATNAAQCQYASTKSKQAAQSDSVILTEQDVIAWDGSTGTWTLDPVRFNNANVMQLVDHCFVLTLTGQRPIRGVVLYSFSARLIEFPTIAVTPRNNALVLQLQSVSGVRNDPLYTPMLHRVLNDKPRAAAQQP